MVKKEDLYNWFKDLHPRKRLDYMCGLLHLCLPLELRFIGTVLEDLGRKDFQHLRDAEIRSNQRNDLSNNPTNNIDDSHLRNKISIALALMKSTNSSCADAIFTILESQIDGLLQLVRNKDIADQISLILTMAVHHPAFKFYQRNRLGEILMIVLKKIKELFGDDEDSLALHVRTHQQRQKSVSPSRSHSSALTSPEKVTVKCIEVVSSRDDQSRKNMKNRDEIPSRRGVTEYEIHTTWSNGEVTQIFMRYKQLQELHRQVLNTFPEEKEKKQRTIPVFPGIQSHRSESLEAQIDSLNSYLSQLIKAPSHVLECEVLHNALRCGTVIHRPLPLPLSVPTQLSCPNSPHASLQPSPNLYDCHPYSTTSLYKGHQMCDNSVAAMTNSMCSSHLSSNTTSPANSRTSSPAPVVGRIGGPPVSSSPSLSPTNIEISLNQFLSLLNLENYSHNLSQFSFKQILSMSSEDLGKIGLPQDAQDKLKTKLNQLKLTPPPIRNGIISKPPGLPPLPLPPLQPPPLHLQQQQAQMHETSGNPPTAFHYPLVQLPSGQLTYLGGVPQFPPGHPGSGPSQLLPYHLAASIMAAGGVSNNTNNTAVGNINHQLPPGMPSISASNSLTTALPQHADLLASPDLPNSEISSPPASPRSNSAQESTQQHSLSGGGSSSSTGSADSGHLSGPLPMMLPADTLTPVDVKQPKITTLQQEESIGVEDIELRSGNLPDVHHTSKDTNLGHPLPPPGLPVPPMQPLSLTEEPVVIMSGTPPPPQLPNGYTVDPAIAQNSLLGRPISISYNVQQRMAAGAGIKLIAQPAHTSAVHNIMKMPVPDPKPSVHHSFMPPPPPGPAHHQTNGNNNNNGGIIINSLTQPPPPQPQVPENYQPGYFHGNHTSRGILTSIANSSMPEPSVYQLSSLAGDTSDSGDGGNNRGSPAPSAPAKVQSTSSTPSPPLSACVKTSGVSVIVTSSSSDVTAGHMAPVRVGAHQSVMPYYIIFPSQNGLVQQPFYPPAGGPPHHAPPPPTAHFPNGIGPNQTQVPPSHEHFLRQLTSANAPQFANAGGATGHIPPSFYGNSVYPPHHSQHNMHQHHHHNNGNGGNNSTHQNRNTGSPASSNTGNGPNSSHHSHGKSLCYNCGLPGHRAADCKESTMENISNSYRLNFEPRADPQ